MATLGGTDFRWPNLSNVISSNLIGTNPATLDARQII